MDKTLKDIKNLLVVKVIKDDDFADKKWIVKDPESPSFWSNDKIDISEGADIVLGGVELSTDKKQRLFEFAFIIDITLFKNKKNLEWPSENVMCGSIILTNSVIKKTVYAEHEKNNVFVDKNKNIIKWQLDNEVADKYIKIAENVIVGVRENYLQEIYARY